MATNWTDEQKKVIELHDRNILVSAAAGSGKTAVLVERIVNMISNQDRKIDIDKLVVVTFTNAAAFEMKQRVLAAIEKRLETDSDNMHLRRQQTLVNHAQITTIDSFCLNIIRNYFTQIDMDPDFRVANDGEIKLLLSDTLDEMIEEYYEQGEKVFLDFAQVYAPGKSDKNISELILNLYNASLSTPWPIMWLQSCKKEYEYKNKEDILQTSFMNFLEEEMKKRIDGIALVCQKAKNICMSAGGPIQYIDAIDDDASFLSQLSNCDVFELTEALDNHKYARLSTKKMDNVSEDKKELVKAIRKEYKDELTNLVKILAGQDGDTVVSFWKKTKPFADIYVDMTIDFYNRIAAAKKKKNVITFSDMEHFALDILVKNVDGKLEYTKVANELAGYYEEILIDEYQDSNMVQEIILNSISKERFGKPNVFMVGDVKQSIYRFRLACPDLFIEKYNSYSSKDSLYQKIELHKNFRSRKEILESTNSVFRKIMKPEFGSISYDDNAALYLGATYPDNDFKPAKSELVIVEKDDNYDEIESQGYVIGENIRNIVGKINVFDKDLGKMRPAKYRDIVILMRSTKKCGDDLVETLFKMGIPAHCESETGYFSAYEIMSVVNFLKVIDNPRQDIAFVSFLKSYFCNLSNNEIASIRAVNKDKSFYDAFLLWNNEKREKISGLLMEYREMARYLSIHELIWNIIYDTGFYDYLSTMPMPAERCANVDMLLEYAKSYENTSFNGLFNFVRYLERLKSFEVDYGEASLSGENDDVVRIMTIHKSKGLEFPVVFLANCHKKLSKNYGDKILIDDNLKISMDFFDLKRRTVKKSVAKNVIVLKKRLEDLGEELRVLYVALTRAKEKLFVVGMASNLEDRLNAYRRAAMTEELSYMELIGFDSYFDMIAPAAFEQESEYSVVPVCKDAVCDIEKSLNSRDSNKEAKNEWMADKKVVSEYVYPHKVVDIPVKMTVSEIKHLRDNALEEEMTMNYLDAQKIDEKENDKEVDIDIESPDIPVPLFISREQKVEGSMRGSAYHKIMEIIDFVDWESTKNIRDFIKCAVDEGYIPQNLASSIEPDDIQKMLNSNLGNQMKKAFACDKLYREKQFVMGVMAKEVFNNVDDDRHILVQGVVDAFFETDEGVVLVDYKTDRVKHCADGERTLIERYEKQLLSYKMAIEQLLNKKVIKTSIYSFELGKELII